MSRFTDKVVIVTGSSAGIGKAAAVRFAQEGAFIVLHGQSQDKLDAVHNEIVHSGVPESRVLVISGPIQDEKIQDKLIEDTVKRFGRLDVLVNNAGISMKTGFDPNSMESFDYVFDVNVRAVYRLIQLSVPHLEKTKGTVVNVSSGLSKKTRPQAMPYSITKAAVNHLTRNFASRLASKGIRVNCVAPGLVKSEFMSRHGTSQEQTAAFYQTAGEAFIPMKRAGEPSEQADTILYLAAATTSYMTGAVIFNDGGITIYSPA